MLEGSISPESRLRVMCAEGAITKFEVRDRTMKDLHMMTTLTDATGEGTRFAAMQRTTKGMRMRSGISQQGSSVMNCILETSTNLEINASVVNKVGDGWQEIRDAARANAFQRTKRFISSF